MANESIVNDVAATGIGSVHIENGIGPPGPEGSFLIMGYEKTFGFEVTGFVKGQTRFKGQRVDAPHRDVKPGSAQGRFPRINLPNNLPSDDF